MNLEQSFYGRKTTQGYFNHPCSPPASAAVKKVVCNLNGQHLADFVLSFLFPQVLSQIWRQPTWR